ncbi:MAG: hypothetical protein HYX68_05875 [Planctomycetes bacterium]|nr:hypothetical protein [Planctomycetota bacterium]
MTDEFLMPKIDVTYGRLGKVLRSFGFSCTVFEKNGQGLRYEHKTTGAIVPLPKFPEGDYVLMHHFVMVRGTSDQSNPRIPARSVSEGSLATANLANASGSYANLTQSP